MEGGRIKTVLLQDRPRQNNGTAATCCPAILGWSSPVGSLSRRRALTSVRIQHGTLSLKSGVSTIKTGSTITVDTFRGRFASSSGSTSLNSSAIRLLGRR
jgi:hypothetical protein